jgi:hypothetical protein
LKYCPPASPRSSSSGEAGRARADDEHVAGAVEARGTRREACRAAAPRDAHPVAHLHHAGALRGEPVHRHEAVLAGPHAAMEAARRAARRVAQREAPGRTQRSREALARQRRKCLALEGDGHDLGSRVGPLVVQSHGGGLHMTGTGFAIPAGTKREE